MFIASNWQDYEILDTGFGRKLERFGKYILDRPDPQVIWNTKLRPNKWERVDGIYHRSSKGGGEWENISMPDVWQISYTFTDKVKLLFNLKPFAFKHTGIFPEQAANWEWSRELIKAANRPIRVLNLFAYTGAASLACASVGAEVTHLDASKGMVNWAKENAVSSKLDKAPIRWLFDDCTKFVQREIRRKNKYDVVIMDPPSYGRGPKGEIWKMEEMIFDFISLTKQVLSDKPLFFLINSYSAGLSVSTIAYMLKLIFGNADIDVQELGLLVGNRDGLVLPCGVSGRVVFREDYNVI